MRSLVNVLPPHTCYVEIFFSGQWRIFGKQLSPVEVVNDHEGPGVIRMQRLLKYAPEQLFAALHSDHSEVVRNPEAWHAACCLKELLDQWEGCALSWEPPQAIEEMLMRFKEPYQRMLTVTWEALPWRTCIDRYDDERAVHIIKPPWSPQDRDQFIALSLRLRRARCQWAVILPPEPALIALFSSLSTTSFVEERWENDCHLIASFVPAPCEEVATKKRKRSQSSNSLSLWTEEREEE